MPMFRSHEPLLPSTSTPPDQTHPPYPTAPQESPLPLSASLKPARYNRRATRRHYVEVDSDDEDGESTRNDGGNYDEYGEVGRGRQMAGAQSQRSTTAKSTSSATVVGDTPKRTKRICIAVGDQSSVSLHPLQEGPSTELAELHTPRLCSPRLTDLLSAYSATPNPDECRTQSSNPNKAGRKCSEGRPCDRCRQRGYTDCRDAPRLRQAGSNADSNLKGSTKMMRQETHSGGGQGYSTLDPQIASLSPCRSRSFFLPSPAPPVVRRPPKPRSPYSSLDTQTPPSFTPPPSSTPLHFPSPRYIIPDTLPHLDYTLNPLPSPHLPLGCPPLITPINRLSPPHKSTYPDSRSYKPTLKLPSIRSLFFLGEDDVDRWKKRLLDESSLAATGVGMGQARFRTSFERTSAMGVRG
ncbi:BZ3500_MvSof-1268-A1-R1_Chr3-1g05817 [Microbotryum saponariae]|uniref:BZ3500_MvSof-1268-A1-R1_Chr3-1g05817 protein n=1 Tax=Microbotryum saponariae TaxID=289078 RepID=A0A2X0L2P4_9BASI|nr:BZ3500_MvSof-1268-A1-R1_Chr3-1g05817 [Microbotryum saponariae]SDA05007.1 BZ3501_MvSof-1269-A2-R1_Chr3-1g05487 [Microbotryum saponariae]